MTESKHDHAIPKLNGFLLWSPKRFGFQHSPKNLILCSLEESLEERKSRRKSRNSAILLSITHIFKSVTHASTLSQSSEDPEAPVMS